MTRYSSISALLKKKAVTVIDNSDKDLHSSMIPIMYDGFGWYSLYEDNGFYPGQFPTTWRIYIAPR